MKQAEKKKGKILFMELKETINNVIKEYCKEADIDASEIAFALGFLTGKVEDSDKGMKHLINLLQIHFFAGVYYGKAKKFVFKYIPKKDKKKIDANREPIKNKKNKMPIPNYFG